jgi:hypothetical protein
MMEGVNSTMIYSINFGKCHNGAPKKRTEEEKIN